MSEALAYLVIYGPHPRDRAVFLERARADAFAAEHHGVKTLALVEQDPDPRASFEAWARGKQYNLVTYDFDPNDYVDWDTDGAWLVWKAAKGIKCI